MLAYIEAKSRSSYPAVHGSLRASWTEPNFNIIGLLCNPLYFTLHSFEYYSERGIHRLCQIAKGPLACTQIEIQEGGNSVYFGVCGTGGYLGGWSQE